MRLKNTVVIQCNPVVDFDKIKFDKACSLGIHTASHLCTEKTVIPRQEGGSTQRLNGKGSGKKFVESIYKFETPYIGCPKRENKWPEPSHDDPLQESDTENGRDTTCAIDNR